MSTIAKTVYAEQIEPLPREVQLQIASLILQTLMETEGRQVEDATSFEAVLPHNRRNVYIRSPRVVSPTGANPLKVEVVE